MWQSTLVLVTIAATQYVLAGGEIKSGDQLVSSVINNCLDMGCVKENVLSYLDTLVYNESRASRKIKNIDVTILKRVAKILKTHEFRVTLPETLFDKTELVYNSRTGLDVAATDTEGRGLLKKKLFLPLLLLLKLKMKALMPLFVAIFGLKAIKALILSKLAIVIVLGFVAYQFANKSGMAMPMSMGTTAPAAEPPPAPMYGAPISSTPSSYEPGWEASHHGGPYSRVWNSANDAQSMAYSSYYPGSVSSSTTRP